MKIVDLAKKMIRLAGLKLFDPVSGEGDIAIQYTGLRPGEKLYEELLINNSNAISTSHPKILAAREPNPTSKEFAQLLRRLDDHLNQAETEQARQLLLQVACQ